MPDLDSSPYPSPESARGDDGGPCPAVSVVIPSYNRADLLTRAIRSVLHQSYRNFELIIVDDASTDQTAEVVASFHDPRIRYVRHDKNRGGAAARNTGVRAAKGEFVAFLDSDDEWLPTKLAEQIELVQNSGPEFGVFYCDSQQVYGSVITKEAGAKYEGDLRPYLLRGWCPAMMSSVLIRQALLQHPFDETLPSFQDYDLWLNLSKYTQFRYLNRPLVLVHRGEWDRVSSNPAKRKLALQTLAAKWQARLSPAEWAAFQQFLRKQRRLIFLAELALTRGRPPRDIVRALVKSFHEGVMPWHLGEWLLLHWRHRLRGAAQVVRSHFASKG